MARTCLALLSACLLLAAAGAFPLIVGPHHDPFFPSAAASPSLTFAHPPPVGFAPPPPPLGLRSFAPSSMSLAHREVVANAEEEAKLPPNLRNPFYKNPRIGAALAKESWFINGEMEVRQREADKIPRGKIFSILKNAGFV
ncbi:uncharacterized protein LOC124165769 [Ischnura elegans]|uniref:uncharacterized protein LOC124165769 n=1 Tax=Ischnura elegans TaxID=197161 RepID=UPI001ED8BD73|nr:uncharacterized protein LOC124165769 [Ischnura elegans]XP_046399218.1 uncharacterized protein LOC124165769 [Ischnura elegans]